MNVTIIYREEEGKIVFLDDMGGPYYLLGFSVDLVPGAAKLADSLKMQKVQATLGVDGLYEFEFTTVFAQAPTLVPIPRWSGGVQLLATFDSVTAIGVNVAGKKSAALMAVGEPLFIDCVEGDVVEFLAIGV